MRGSEWLSDDCNLTVIRAVGPLPSSAVNMVCSTTYLDRFTQLTGPAGYTVPRDLTRSGGAKCSRNPYCTEAHRSVASTGAILMPTTYCPRSSLSTNGTAISLSYLVITSLRFCYSVMVGTSLRICSSSISILHHSPRLYSRLKYRNHINRTLVSEACLKYL